MGQGDDEVRLFLALADGGGHLVPVHPVDLRPLGVGAAVGAVGEVHEGDAQPAARQDERVGLLELPGVARRAGLQDAERVADALVHVERPLQAGAAPVEDVVVARQEDVDAAFVGAVPGIIVRRREDGIAGVRLSAQGKFQVGDREIHRAQRRRDPLQELTVIAHELLRMHHHVPDDHYADGVRSVEDGFRERDLILIGEEGIAGTLCGEPRGGGHQQDQQEYGSGRFHKISCKDKIFCDLELSWFARKFARLYDYEENTGHNGTGRHRLPAGRMRFLPPAGGPSHLEGHPRQEGADRAGSPPASAAPGLAEAGPEADFPQNVN